MVTGAQGALRGSYSTARTRKMPHAQGESGLSKVQIRLPEEAPLRWSEPTRIPIATVLFCLLLGVSAVIIGEPRHGDRHRLRVRAVLPA